MGTEITLRIENITLTYSKNDIGDDHSSIFQEKDHMPVTSDQINYDYFKEAGKSPGHMEAALVRSLKEIKPRLKLLGFNLQHAEDEYNKKIKEADDNLIYEEIDFNKKERPTFTEFCKLITQRPVSSFSDEYIDYEDQEKEMYKIRGRLTNCKFKSLPSFERAEADSYSESSYFSYLIGFIDPYSILIILAENEENLEARVIWQYGPLVYAGWASKSDFISGSNRNEKFLLLTEGKSDTKIIKHALENLYPEIYDFFNFIDLDINGINHPFFKASELAKLVKSLVTMDIQNKTVAIFDNDAEGNEQYETINTDKLPENIQIMLLPKLSEFNNFPTIGPDGESYGDINGKAVAIECFLDLDSGEEPKAKVRWNSYKKKVGLYQGALDSKETYSNKFCKQTRESLMDGSYDTRKIKILIDALLEKCYLISKQ
ncbi:HEPN/Toprim-associated domain-containing protein [Piscirickettsia litoralis]|uniref:HEPN/Toprim N-terminal domain-containing protein n=1 Tax=Piscirickettsia litoralis TaxID=1891921 RepID=A0ABX2ZXU3_9GAMM|nr:HEPN/Toprim-associated domain-containing protein [Piscirickettsia litoralis]ODN41434.1 hypothetical protein BGC07_16465 [Piscirickettsia litoralis]